MSAGVIQRRIGGETGGRGMLGRGERRARTKGLIASFVAFVAIALMWNGVVGIAVGAVGAAATWLLTLKTGVGMNALASRQGKRRVVERAKTGRDGFIPVRQRPADLDERVLSSRGRAKKAALREWGQYRDVHDAADGLTWLQAVPGKAGISWHVPPGEEAYLSVVIPVAGQIQGLESDRKVSSVATRFGDMQAAHGEMTSRIRRTQLMARLLPVDTAAHERWVMDNIDKAAPKRLLQSYAQVLGQLQTGHGGLAQRYFAVGRWAVTPRLLAAAGRRGEGVPGLVSLMNSEIDAFYRRLASAGLRPAAPLTAAQVAAVCRHQQMPSWPLDRAADLNPYDPDPWLAEQDMVDHSVVTDLGPVGQKGDLQEQSWWHTTARVSIAEVETGLRDPMWLLPLLSGMGHPVIRTVSLEQETIPASQARTQAKEDLTIDLADLASQAKKGQLEGEDLKAAKEAAQHRVEDLAPGTGHHGNGWCMHITISAPSREDLVESMELVDEAAGHCGLGALQWLDDAGVAHHGYTLPFARALAPPKENLMEKARVLMAGKGRKDGLR